MFSPNMRKLFLLKVKKFLLAPLNEEKHSTSSHSSVTGFNKHFLNTTKLPGNILFTKDWILKLTSNNFH